jgi:hypothetical protein
LKKLWQEIKIEKEDDSDFVDAESESSLNPYGDFVSENITSVHVHRFTKGYLLTVLQDDRRRYSEFFKYDEAVKHGERKKKEG